MTAPELFILAMTGPLLVACAWANNRRRILECENKRLRKQLVDLIAPPGLAPINEIEHRLALRKAARDAGFQLHKRRA